MKITDKDSKYLCRLTRDNLMGGLSIVFHGSHKKGVTKLREQEFDEEAADCDTILGVYGSTLPVIHPQGHVYGKSCDQTNGKQLCCQTECHQL